MNYKLFSVQGFNDAKILKFGPEWVRTIRILCNLDPDLPDEDKKTMQEILSQYPLDNTPLGSMAESTYSYFTQGLTISEIATKRYKSIFLYVVYIQHVLISIAGVLFQPQLCHILLIALRKDIV